MKEVLEEANRRGVKVIACRTMEAIRMMKEEPADTNAILHVTC
jgi:hypothetical protein